MATFSNHLLLSLSLSSLALSIPHATPATTAYVRTSPSERQDLPELLALASEAGIALPTDPAVLLSLYPLATELIGYLPTEPVLSVLETAVPSGVISQVAHDPSFAASLEQAFASGSPPSWFSALPSDVKSYLHTYQAGSLASEIVSVESGLDMLPHSIIGQNQTGSAHFGPLASGTASSAETSLSTSAAVLQSVSGTETVATSSTPRSLAASTASVVLSSAQSAASVTSSRASAAASSITSSARAPRETQMLAAGVAAALGAVGMVAML